MTRGSHVRQPICPHSQLRLSSECGPQSGQPHNYRRHSYFATQILTNRLPFGGSHEVHACGVQIYEIHVCEVHVHEVQAHETHAYEVYGYEIRTYEVYTHEVHILRLHACEREA